MDNELRNTGLQNELKYKQLLNELKHKTKENMDLFVKLNKVLEDSK